MGEEAKESDGTELKLDDGEVSNGVGGGGVGCVESVAARIGLARRGAAMGASVDCSTKKESCPAGVGGEVNGSESTSLKIVDGEVSDGSVGSKLTGPGVSPELSEGRCSMRVREVWWLEAE